MYENPLLYCLHDRPTPLIHVSRALEDGDATLVTSPVPWFARHLALPNAYAMLKQEYYDISELWHSTRNHVSAGSYIQEPYGNGVYRKLSVNAQQINSQYAGNGLYASEGPTRSSVFDFWSLIFHHKITSIMSVNYPLEERHTSANHNEDTETIQYWPFVEGQEMTFMPYTIRCVSSDCKISPTQSSSCSSSVVYRLSKLLVHYCNPVLRPQPPLNVTHVCYYRWPDGRLPVPIDNQSTAETSLALLDIVEKASHFDLAWPVSPLLIHCHAGIGRTGSLMAILLASQRASDQNTIDLKETVQELRKSRAKAVMNYWQYIFVYLSIAEVLVHRGELDETAKNRLSQLWNELLADISRQYE